MHPEDQKLLEVARELCRQLGYFKFNPQTILWTERIGLRRVPADSILLLRDEIRLSKQSMGKLTPEEWRPIFTSGLVYYKNLQRQTMMAMLTGVVPLALILPIAIFLSFQYLEDLILRLSVIVALIALTIFMTARFIAVPRELWFKADEEAAQLVGKESLLASLRKMDQIDATQTGRRRRTPLPPSLSQRIERLTQAKPP